MMRISYNKLWKMLIDKNMKKSDLKESAPLPLQSWAKETILQQVCFSAFAK